MRLGLGFFLSLSLSVGFNFFSCAAASAIMLVWAGSGISYRGNPGSSRCKLTGNGNQLGKKRGQKATRGCLFPCRAFLTKLL